MIVKWIAAGPRLSPIVGVAPPAVTVCAVAVPRETEGPPGVRGRSTRVRRA